MTPRQPHRSRLHRRVGTRDQRERILFVAAGTAVRHLHTIRDAFRADMVDVRDSGDDDPVAVVTRAWRERAGYDQVWAFLEPGDRWHLRRRWKLRRAVSLAGRRSVKLVVAWADSGRSPADQSLPDVVEAAVSVPQWKPSGPPDRRDKMPDGGGEPPLTDVWLVWSVMRASCR